MIPLCIFTYLFVVNVAAFTDSEIIDRTSENIGREKCDYSQIEKISAYFSDGEIKNRLNNIYKGSFLYEITLPNKKFIITETNKTTNKKYFEPYTYSQVVYLDKKLVDMGINKYSSKENIEYSKRDKEHIDKFLGIIENK